ncbi:MAG: phospholipid carrier-dependent glycosyltransferase, partial [Candidatus Dormibacteria bacterium]
MTAVWTRITARPRTPLVLLGLLSIASFGARIFRLDQPNALIVDERVYVNAARAIAGVAVPAGQLYSDAPAGHDPNYAHPPLVKVIIALGIRLFGDNPVGWRAGSVLFGSLALLAMFWLVRAAGGNRWLALGGAALMAVDNLLLVLGRVGMLEIVVLTFMLASVALYLQRRYLLAGVVLGIGALAKLTAWDVLFIILLIEVGQVLAARWSSAEGETMHVRTRLRGLVMLTAGALVTYLAALGLFDLELTGYRNPVAHTVFMFQALASPRGPSPSLADPHRDFSSPAWAWLLNDGGINFWHRNQVVYSPSGDIVATRPVIAMVSNMNPFIIFLAIPAFGAALHAGWRERDRVALLAAAWCVGSFGPFLFLSAVLQRTRFQYYMAIVMPGIYIAIALLFAARRLPRA